MTPINTLTDMLAEVAFGLPVARTVISGAVQFRRSGRVERLAADAATARVAADTTEFDGGAFSLMCSFRPQIIPQGDGR